MPNQPVIIIISLLLGLCSGVIMHRSDFCIAGMFRDLFLFRSSPLLRSLLLLITISMLLFEAARLIGLLNYQLPSSLYGLPSLANLFGGVLFGVGMVLAGGCAVGTLYKLGSGNGSAFFALSGLIAGSTIFAEFHPAWKQFSASTRLADVATLPQLLSLPKPLTILPLVTIFSILLIFWQRQGMMKRPSIVKGYLQPRTAAVMLAGIVFFSFALIGMPLGLTTSYAKIGAFLENLAAPEHFATLEYFHAQGFRYYSPLAHHTLSAGAGPAWDGLSLAQFPLIIGIVGGSAASAILMGKFHISLKLPKAQIISALLGGLLMGAAARMAPSCNVWHLLGGLPLLSLQSILFTLGLLPGAWCGSKLLTRFVLKA
ncbi:hypothetical protein SAMN02745165_00405 [Malonomonas rubra DSM 5091]|uniref:Uncharacterized protein n=1 Tax=Malonomonas rubra DSM 5091 TaxID=1122189 RepID=A0A1M6C4T9_MALRU|nr:YeeE/YedE family protein [Malonomonas rubra]SHI55953.1 hypothetical protein SAMN02745165_00405 [Malonomonas rubra DSM 5091]